MSPRRVPDGDMGRTAAIEALRGGAIVALPTDTVYGIATALDARDGIRRLFAAKSRPPDRSIALLVATRAQAETLGEFSATARELADAFWPGGLTLIVPRREGVALPPELTSDAGTVGLRVPDHAAPRALAAAVGPLPTTSANRSGEPEAHDADAIASVLGDAIDLILDGGPAPGGPASTVVDCTGPRPRVLRVGAVALEAIEAVVGR